MHVASQEGSRPLQRRKSQQRTGSVQSEFLKIREVNTTVVSIVSPADPQCRQYRTILEVQGINFPLKA